MYVTYVIPVGLLRSLANSSFRTSFSSTFAISSLAAIFSTYQDKNTQTKGMVKKQKVINQEYISLNQTGKKYEALHILCI